MHKTNLNFLQVWVTEKSGSQLGKQIKGQPESNCSPIGSLTVTEGLHTPRFGGHGPTKCPLAECPPDAG